jgi:glycosyltransferase involved in cell wall biosynthesis
MKIQVLHISHTDIRFDNRILKELNCLQAETLFSITGFGIFEKKFLFEGDSDLKGSIRMFSLFSRRILVLPRLIRYIFVYFELFIRMTVPAIKLNPKVIHCHDTLVLPIGCMVKLFTGSKLIYDAHELESRKNGQGRILSGLTYLVEKILWRFVDFFITVSPSIVQWYEEKLGPKQNEIILNSPIYMESIKRRLHNESYFRKLYAISDENKIFLYLGIIGKGRGVEMYLNIFESEGISSHIVFMGYGDLVDDVINRSKGCNRIHFHPRVEHERVVEISQSADVGLAIIEDVSLSDYYCLPNKLFEYAFAGIPVLASDFPDMKRMIEEYKLGATTKIDYQSVRDSIIRIQEFGLSASDCDLFPISWQNQSNILMDVYKSLV